MRLAPRCNSSRGRTSSSPAKAAAGHFDLKHHAILFISAMDASWIPNGLTHSIPSAVPPPSSSNSGAPSRTRCPRLSDDVCCSLHQLPGSPPLRLHMSPRNLGCINGRRRQSRRIRVREDAGRFTYVPAPLARWRPAQRLPGNPFRESGPPANMAKLILLRQKVCSARFRPLQLPSHRSADSDEQPTTKKLLTFTPGVTIIQCSTVTTKNVLDALWEALLRETAPLTCLIYSPSPSYLTTTDNLLRVAMLFIGIPGREATGFSFLLRSAITLSRPPFDIPQHGTNRLTCKLVHNMDHINIHGPNPRPLTRKSRRFVSKPGDKDALSLLHHWLGFLPSGSTPC